MWRVADTSRCPYLWCGMSQEVERVKHRFQLVKKWGDTASGTCPSVRFLRVDWGEEIDTSLSLLPLPGLTAGISVDPKGASHIFTLEVRHPTAQFRLLTALTPLGLIRSLWLSPCHAGVQESGRLHLGDRRGDRCGAGQGELQSHALEAFWPLPHREA